MISCDGGANPFIIINFSGDAVGKTILMLSLHCFGGIQIEKNWSNISSALHYSQKSKSMVYLTKDIYRRHQAMILARPSYFHTTNWQAWWSDQRHQQVTELHRQLSHANGKRSQVRACSRWVGYYERARRRVDTGSPKQRTMPRHDSVDWLWSRMGGAIVQRHANTKVMER